MSEDPEFAVLIASVGERRIAVYQELRRAVSWSLWGASRALAELPLELPSTWQFPEARRLVAALRAAGATAGLRCGWCARAVDPEVPADPGPCREQTGFYGDPCRASA
ncbi:MULTISPECIES: hypothetical protein [Kitasatospora]|uniref:Ribosomal protein L7/L12 C-terminal domain-containing protein n=1 Tax=Kitasatospora setae (strain ATCC 33774 / DSM 43861 / JCM 3304 / KCC A-0304 / NBRC 14216 / KM-6054) TaxID=452652 RepID=E4N7M3_KITSK|nr:MULTISPECIES: hypothetical protein [Kitasatospora]BAJ27204.1 hypothetical protein KSE_13760 [Kitasatospora setae KM-6054]